MTEGKEETALLLNISDMIDLAIGTPEVGVVDFNMLHTVLHCLAQQLRVLGKNVELRGSIATMPINLENVQTVAIQEFLVDTNESDEKVKKIETKGVAPPPPPEEPPTMLVVERVKKTDSPLLSVQHSPKRSASPTQGKTSEAAEDKSVTTVAVTSQLAPLKIPFIEKLSLVTVSKFNVLEGVVEDLKNRVYSSIPKNEDILQEVRSQTNLKAITDMWTSLNVSSRLEAAEEGIAKLSSLVQDLIGEAQELQDAIKRRESQPPQAPEPVPQREPSKVAMAAAPKPEYEGPPLATKEDVAALQALFDRLDGDLNNLTNTFYTAVDDLQNEMQGLQQPLSSQAEPARTQPPEPQQEREPPARRSFHTAGIMERINELEKKLQKCCESVGKADGVTKDQLSSFQDQLEYLLKTVDDLNKRVSDSGNNLSPDLVKDLQGLMELFTTVQDMQEQLKQVHETALQLAAEKDERQGNLNVLLEQIELLKTIKMDREDMEEAMAEKADMRALARKVSHDKFEMACDDLSRGLEHALGKLNLQEELWQQALDDIQREIETKLDKMELGPMRDFFNNKLKQLQENLKQMASLRREAEAAGTKRRLLRDVNCISCDARAVMPMEPASNIPISKPLQASYSMKPYLSYELDAIRKSQASQLPQRNMHDWETIDKQMTAKPPPKAKSESDKPEKHICNRYCGGSHTTTTPAQRVARLGHFIKQWGPDVLPLSSGLAAGDDGKMYRVSPAEGANVGPGGAVDQTCTPKPPARKSESKVPHKPLVISAECRCLEGDRQSKG